MTATSLPSQWQKAIANAILNGNTLHDCAFEGQAVNVDAFKNFEDELELAAYDEQHCYCQNQDLGNLVALFMQSEASASCLMSVHLLYWVLHKENLLLLRLTSTLKMEPWLGSQVTLPV